MEKNYSVLMSVYNREKAQNLKESIESMFAQTLPPQDFVVVCDGVLGEELYEVLRQKKEEWSGNFQIVQLPENRGLGEALKAGLPYCKYEIVARMDSDDISAPKRCEWQIEALLDQNVSVVSGTVQEFSRDISNGGAMRRVPETADEIVKYARKRSPFNHPAVMFRKSDVLKAGNYMNCHGFEDYHLWIRMLEKGMKGYNLSEVLVYMRVDDGMYTRRGGWKYFKDMVAFRRFMLDSGYISLPEFILLIMLHGSVILIPARIRKIIYAVFLRK